MIHMSRGGHADAARSLRTTHLARRPRGDFHRLLSRTLHHGHDQSPRQPHARGEREFGGGGRKKQGAKRRQKAEHGLLNQSLQRFHRPAEPEPVKLQD
jgi:hypothetical protein